MAFLGRIKSCLLFCFWQKLDLTWNHRRNQKYGSRLQWKAFSNANPDSWDRFLVFAAFHRTEFPPWWLFMHELTSVCVYILLHDITSSNGCFRTSVRVDLTDASKTEPWCAASYISDTEAAPRNWFNIVFHVSESHCGTVLLIVKRLTDVISSPCSSLGRCWNLSLLFTKHTQFTQKGDEGRNASFE